MATPPAHMSTTSAATKQVRYIHYIITSCSPHDFRLHALSPSLTEVITKHSYEGAAEDVRGPTGDYDPTQYGQSGDTECSEGDT